MKKAKQYIVWIDKDINEINDYIELYDIKTQYEIISFSNFTKSLEFIKKHSNQISLIISNYCTFYWVNVHENNPSNYIYDFYQSVTQINSNIPYICFSSFAGTDKKFKSLIKEDKFQWVAKSVDVDLNSIINKSLSYKQTSTHITS